MTRIIFAGTPEFAVPSLQALIADSRYQIISVFTQPDRPKGRGQKLQASPIKQVAQAHGIPVYQPSTLKDSDTQKILKDQQSDVMIVAAYGLLLPEAILNIPKHGCINIHGSLLPKWRGAAPVQRAIEAGDTKTGITIMQMEKGLDTGGMFYQKTCAITPEDTSASLMAKLAEVGALGLMESLPKILSGELHAQAQDEHQATYAKKLGKAEALIHWPESAEVIARKIRAFYPWPCAFFEAKGQTIKVGSAEVISHKNHHPAGEIIQCNEDALIIACGENALKLTQIQFPGGKMQASQNYLRSLALRQALTPP